MTQRINFSIRIVDSDGEGVNQATIRIEDNWGVLSQSWKRYVDGEGWAEYELILNSDKIFIATVYVDIPFQDTKEIDFDDWMEDGETYSFAI